MQEILCKKCGSDDVSRKGIKKQISGKKQIWRCKDCGHKFATDYKEIELSGGKFKEYSHEELTENAMFLETAVRNVRTIEDLIAFHDIDMSIWKIDKQVVNFWGKQGNRQVKGWFKKIEKDEIDMKEVAERFIKEAGKASPKVNKIKYKKSKVGKLLEIGPVDQHLAQLSWSKETGFADYDLKIGVKSYIDAVEYLGSKSATIYNVDRILFVVGHDYFNSDNENATTAKGTPQSEDSRWQKSFYVGCDTIIKAANFLRQIAPVDIKVVQGNHDKQRSFYMGAYVQAWFRNDKNITVDNDPTIRKYYEYGQNLIGMAHMGNDDKLAQLMPLERPEMWARTKHRIIRKAHVHHESKKYSLLDTEVSGIKITTLSTLVALDAWHCEMGFHSMRQSQAFIHDKTKGKEAEFNFVL